MAHHYRPARREPSTLLIGLAGPTGSGKTFSAFRLAKGIVSVTGGKIAVGDTERGRALQYAPDSMGYEGFEFLHCDIEPPYSADNYLDAFVAGEEAAGEGGVLIIDSMSHEHEGEGGLLDAHDAEVKRMSGGDTKKAERVKGFAWVKPKQARRKLVSRVIQARCHVICCFRAKEKVKMAKVDNKMTIVPIGWQPITGDDWPYEMTIMALMDDKRKGVPIISEFDAGKLPDGLQERFPTNKRLSEATGIKLAQWALAGSEAPSVDTRSDFAGRQAAPGEPRTAAPVGNTPPDRPRGSQRPTERRDDHADIPFETDDAPIDLPGDDNAPDPDDGQIGDESVEVIFDQHSEDDKEYAATPAEGAQMLASRMKAASTFYASRMLTLNSEWIQLLNINWQNRLEAIVVEKQRAEQAHG